MGLSAAALYTPMHSGTAGSLSADQKHSAAHAGFEMAQIAINKFTILENRTSTLFILINITNGLVSLFVCVVQKKRLPLDLLFFAYVLRVNIFYITNKINSGSESYAASIPVTEIAQLFCLFSYCTVSAF